MSLWKRSLESFGYGERDVGSHRYSDEMLEITGAAIGAIAVICIPLVAWFSRRATPEGRLTLRVERLGRVFAVMPESHEKDAFMPHLTNAIKNLNDWLDPGARKRRRLTQGISALVYFVGIALAVIVVNHVDEPAKQWVSAVVGVVLGVVLAGAVNVTAKILEKIAQRESAIVAARAESDAAAKRMEALRLDARITDRVKDAGRKA